jgi:hypothetical protein
MYKPPFDAEQIAQVIEVSVVQWFFLSANGVGNLDVTHGGKRGQQVEALEDEANALLAQAGAIGIVQRGKIDAVNDDAPAGSACEAAEQVKERRLAGSRRTDDGYKFATRNLERDTADGRDLDLPGTIDLGEVVGLNNGGFRRCLHGLIVNGAACRNCAGSVTGYST